MKVALISEHASPLAVLGGVDAGGQNVHVACLARELAAVGASVDVYTRRDNATVPKCVPLEPGVRVVHVDAGPPWTVPKDELLPHMDAFGDELHETWRADPPDVAHAHFWMSAYATLRGAAGLGIPVAQTFHALGVVKRRYQGDRDTSPDGRLDIERKIVRRVDRIIATCTDEVFELLRMGADTDRVTVIPSGVDLKLFTPRGPVEQRHTDVKRLVYVGRLVERKGIGNVITALSDLPDTELVIAGGPARDALADDPDAQRLAQIARDHGVDERVELRGRVGRDELPPLLRSADAVVAVPWYEPFGIVPLEAMACGVPVVAAAVGGMIDTVVDGVTGVHVAPRDPDRLVAALHSLLGDPDLCKSYGRAGAQRARRLYDWSRIGRTTMETYRNLIRARRGRHKPQRRFERTSSHAREHIAGLQRCLDDLGGAADHLDRWGGELAAALRRGQRLLVAGNGGSAAEAQHLTAELVGRYENEREPLSAICLHADSSSFTAICNDYGAHEAFARQVRAHGCPGDVLLTLSTSGRSENILQAVAAAHEAGLTTWALTGRGPNPLADVVDDAVCVPAGSTATIQELHLVCVHLLCAAVERHIAATPQIPRAQATGSIAT